MEMREAMEAGMPLENAISFGYGLSQNVTPPLDGQEQQDAILLADEFGVAVREALK